LRMLIKVSVWWAVSLSLSKTMGRGWIEKLYFLITKLSYYFIFLFFDRSNDLRIIKGKIMNKVSVRKNFCSKMVNCPFFSKQLKLLKFRRRNDLEEIFSVDIFTEKRIGDSRTQ